MAKKTTKPAKKATTPKRTRTKDQKPAPIENVQAVEEAPKEEQNIPEFPFYLHTTQEKDGVTALVFETKVKILRKKGEKFMDSFLVNVRSVYEADSKDYSENSKELVSKALPLHLKQCMKSAVFMKVPEDFDVESADAKGVEYAGTFPSEKIIDTY